MEMQNLIMDWRNSRQILSTGLAFKIDQVGGFPQEFKKLPIIEEDIQQQPYARLVIALIGLLAGSVIMADDMT